MARTPRDCSSMLDHPSSEESRHTRRKVYDSTSRCIRSDTRVDTGNASAPVLYSASNSPYLQVLSSTGGQYPGYSHDDTLREFLELETRSEARTLRSLSRRTDRASVRFGTRPQDRESISQGDTTSYIEDSNISRLQQIGRQDDSGPSVDTFRDGGRDDGNIESNRMLSGQSSINETPRGTPLNSRKTNRKAKRPPLDCAPLTSLEFGIAKSPNTGGSVHNDQVESMEETRICIHCNTRLVMEDRLEVDDMCRECQRKAEF
jgi:hypothetical protein